MNKFLNSIKKELKRITHKIFFIIDYLIPKEPNYWVFPVCFLERKILCNLRGVFEEVRNDPNIKKIILTRDLEINLTGNNITYAPLRSWKGLFFLMRSKIIFLRHSISSNVEYRLSSTKHHFINLWHGIPLKRIGNSVISSGNKKKRSAEKYSMVISSSDIDRLAMASSIAGSEYRSVAITGLPRNDFILCKSADLPKDLQDESHEIRMLKKDKKLVLYAPTFRDKTEQSYEFTSQEKLDLKNILDKHDAVLGIREHMASKESNLSIKKQLLELNPIDMNKFPNIEMIYRNTDILITDYSSCFIDFMLTNNPIVNFSYDHDNYTNKERGLFYDMELVFPNTINKLFPDFIHSLDAALSNKIDTNHYLNCKKIFFKYFDSQNSKRVAELIKELNLND